LQGRHVQQQTHQGGREGQLSLSQTRNFRIPDDALQESPYELAPRYTCVACSVGVSNVIRGNAADLRELGCEGMEYPSGSVQEPAAGSCEHGNEPSGSIKDGEVLDWLCDFQLLEKDYAPCN
jgi:hypothetical protein